MRGRAVPTMVWSSAARKSASATPTVARMRALRVISADIRGLLGDGFDRVMQVGKGGSQAGALVGRQTHEHVRDAMLHVIAVSVELVATARRQLHEHDATIV